ncbi:MAG: LacI family DNA-binding transcriptional regulator [Oscillospiraceae bacterium]
MNKKMSMINIAELSGVSIATVSRVLNKNGRYSPETEKKVIDIVKKYDYKVNPNAKGLRTNKTQSIGVIVPDITNEFFAKIIRSIENSIMPKGYTVFVCDSNENGEMEEHHISSLVAKDVDGIIYISTKPDVKHIYDEYKIPVVYIDRRPQNAGTLIISDNEMGGFIATEELIKKGCQKIVMLRDKNRYSTVVNRYEGFVNAHKKHNLLVNEKLVIDMEVSYKSSHDAVKELINSGEKFDGIFCNNDIMAIGALHALRDAKIKVPSEVKIIGFDGISLTEICDPPMTTVMQDTDMFGKKSVEALLRLIENKEPKKDEVYTIPVTLKKRSTT